MEPENRAQEQPLVELRSLEHRQVYLTPALTEEIRPHLAGAVRDFGRKIKMARQQTEAKYDNIFENAVVGIFQCTAGGQWLRVNPALARILGYASPEELMTAVTDIGRQLYVDSNQWAEFVELLAETEVLAEYEIQVHHKEGHAIWIEQSARAVRDASGRLLYYEGFIENITRRKQIEAELHRRASQQAAVAWLGQLALAQTTLSPLMIEAAALMTQTLVIEGSAILELLPDGQQVILRAGVGWPAELFDQVVGTIRPVTAPLQANEPVFIIDPNNNQHFAGPALLSHQGVISQLWVPILGQGRPAGVLGVHTSQLRTFGQDDLHFLQAVANVLAAAIERKQTEVALRESETRYRLVSEMVSDYVYALRCHPNGRLTIEWVTDAFTRMTGFTMADLESSDNPLNLIHPEDQALFFQRLPILLSGQPDISEYRIITKNGQVRWVQGYTRPLWDEKQGRVTYIYGASQDITERKEAELRLKQSQASLAEAQRIGHFGNWERNLRTDKEHWSDELYRLLGVKPQEFSPTYQAFLDFVHSDDRRLIETAIQAALHKQKNYSLDYRIVRLDGEIRILHSQAEVIFDQAGYPVRLIGTLQDITERKQLEMRLEAIYQLGEELTLLRDQTAIVQRVLQAANSMLHFHLIGFGLVDEATQELEYHYRLVNGRLEQGSFKLPLTGERGIGLTVVRSKEALNIADTSQDSRYLPVHGLFCGRSELCVPMKVGERVIGVLNAESVKSNGFSPADQQLLQTLADQAAVALENAQLYAEIEQRVQQLTALHQLDRAISASLHINDIYHAFAHHVGSLLCYDHLSIILVEGDEVRITYLVAENDTFLPAGMVLPRQTSAPGWVVAQGQPLLRHDITADMRFFGDKELVASGIHSALMIPLWVKGQIIGTCNIGSRQKGKYGPDDMEIAQSMADQLAIAIENARLYEAEQEQFRRLQQSQAQLIRAEKMAALGRLVASIAHEINNPIQAIHNCLALAEEELAETRNPQKLNWYVSMAKDELDRIATIVRRMRDFYRPAGQAQAYHTPDSSIEDDFYRLTQSETQPIDLHALLESVLCLTHKQLQHHRIKVECNWTDNLPLTQANPDHLKQVFLNLILNAIDAMAAQNGGSLSITAGLDQANLFGEQAQPVIKLEFKDTGPGVPAKILSHLFEPLFTTKVEGSGLGLFTSYKIIEAHHGQISVDSQPGTGTTFTILLPLRPV